MTCPPSSGGRDVDHHLMQRKRSGSVSGQKEGEKRGYGPLFLPMPKSAGKKKNSADFLKEQTASTPGVRRELKGKKGRKKPIWGYSTISSQVEVSFLLVRERISPPREKDKRGAIRLVYSEGVKKGGTGWGRKGRRWGICQGKGGLVEYRQCESRKRKESSAAKGARLSMKEREGDDPPSVHLSQFGKEKLHGLDKKKPRSVLAAIWRKRILEKRERGGSRVLSELLSKVEKEGRECVRGRGRKDQSAPHFPLSSTGEEKREGEPLVPLEKERLFVQKKKGGSLP